jgi:hypothetical protein
VTRRRNAARSPFLRQVDQREINEDAQKARQLTSLVEELKVRSAGARS